MPLPIPNKGEEQKAFIARCISFIKHEDPATPDQQASAMAYSQWRKR